MHAVGALAAASRHGEPVVAFERLDAAVRAVAAELLPVARSSAAALLGEAGLRH